MLLLGQCAAPVRQAPKRATSEVSGQTQCAIHDREEPQPTS